MELITKKTNMYKSIKENGYTDFPNINVRVLYYKDIDDGGEYAISINLNNKNKILDIEQFHKFNFETLSS
tara:strand:- start:921 stop:1130 length:210 start_codon:yes stop_codon:yes gene_type:complete